MNKYQMLLHPSIGNHPKYTMDRMDPKAQRSGVTSMVLEDCREDGTGQTNGWVSQGQRGYWEEEDHDTLVRPGCLLEHKDFPDFRISHYK